MEFNGTGFSGYGSLVGDGVSKTVGEFVGGGVGSGVLGSAGIDMVGGGLKERTVGCELDVGVGKGAFVAVSIARKGSSSYNSKPNRTSRIFKSCGRTISVHRRAADGATSRKHCNNPSF